MLLVSALKAKETSSTQTFRQQSDLIPHSAELPLPLFTSLPEVVDVPESSATEMSTLEDDCNKPLPDYRSQY